jgi:acetolactate synthase-1/2/3 large subunit
MGKFQELDHIAMIESVCKYARVILDANRIPFYVHEAFSRATSGRPGPVHLTVPLDVLEADVEAAQLCFDRKETEQVKQRGSGDPELVRDAVQLLARAQRPVLVAGSGVFYADAEDSLARFAGLSDIPVVIPIWDRGSVSQPLQNFLGVVGAASGGPQLLSDSDLVMLLGVHIDYRVGYALPPTIAEEAKIVRIDIDAQELGQGVQPDIGVLGDLHSVLEQCIEEWLRRECKPHSAWLEEACQRDHAFRTGWLAAPTGTTPMTGHHVVEALRPFVQDDTIFLVDGGNIGQWMHMALCDRYPGHWLTCGASGVVGWGLPGAMGAKLAYPDRPVILLSGDGAFTFTVAELECATRHRLPFVIVLADDQAWGIVVSGQQKRYGEDGILASRTGPIRYDLVAQGFGANGVRVERPEEIGPAIQKGLAADRPTLIHVPIRTGGPADG